MPRIDPYTLIKTLGLLLSPNGGIRSSEEVTRIVQLMHKFSKKMVSKCMYIQILKATTSELLEKFLAEKGWDLLNSWLSESVASENWAQCKELIKLFSECPVTATAIEDNLGLKLVKKLTNDVGVDEQVKELALKVLKKWMSIVNPFGDPKLVLSSRQDNLERNGGLETTDEVVDLKSNVDSVDETSRTKESFSVAAVELPKSSSNVNGIKSKNNDDSKEGKRIFKRETETEKADKKKSRKHDTEKQRDKKGKDRTEKKSKPYSQTELRNDLGEMERSRIKGVAQKLKDDIASKKESSKEKSSTKNSTTSVSKKEIKEKGTSSFTDMLGALDSSKAKTTVKVAGSKNKNKGLLESLSSTNISKPPSSKHKQVKPTSSKHLLPNSSLDVVTTSLATKSKRDKTEDNISNSLPIDVPEKKSEKRPIEMDHPIVKNKAVLKECDIFGNVLSTAMHDELALNDYPRKKKLRLSDVKSGKASSEAPKAEPEIEKKLDTFSFYGAGETKGNESQMENGIGNILNTAEDDKFSPDQASELNEERTKTHAPIVNEVSGILVIARGSKTTRNVNWKPDKDLVQIEYFDLDETERINVNKVKFDTMRQREAAMEKERFKTLMNKGAEEDEEDSTNSNNRIPWKLVELHSESALQEFGSGSQEKLTQAHREQTVLQAIIFNRKMPPVPSEPDFSVIPEGEPTLVPLEDTDENSELFDYSLIGWYPSEDNRVPITGPFSSPSSFETHNKPNVSLNNALLAIQSFGQERLSPPVVAFYQESELKGPTSDKDYPIEPNVPPLQQNNMAPLNFYGNGMEGNEAGVGPQPFYSGLPDSTGSHGGNNGFHDNGYDATGSQRGNNGFHDNRYDSTGSHGGNNGFHEEMDQSRSESTWNKEQGRGFGRGFSYRNGGNRGYNGRGGGGGFRNNQNKLKDRNGGGRGGKQFIRGQKGESRPCKFWVEKGRCVHEERCRFKHPSQ